jgi:PPOX class probable F420-dependent enzyme
MQMDAGWARAQFAAARVARLATVDGDGQPHLVPIVFAVSGTFIYSAVDAKPKSTLELARLRNIRANPGVSVLIDHYAEDWTQLWWARADADAWIVDRANPEWPVAVAELTDRYVQYRTQPPPGPVLVLAVRRWSGWSAQR